MPAAAVPGRRRTALRWTLSVLLAPAIAAQFGTPFAALAGFVLAVLWWGRAAGLLALFLAVASLAFVLAVPPAREHASSGPGPAANSSRA